MVDGLGVSEGEGVLQGYWWAASWCCIITVIKGVGAGGLRSDANNVVEGRV